MTTLKRYEGGRIKGGCSLHDAEKPELCQKHLHRCPEPRTVDKWDVQREDPTGMGGPTIETGEGWNDNFDGDVIAWIAIPPHPPAEWDQRLPSNPRQLTDEEMADCGLLSELQAPNDGANRTAAGGSGG